MKCDEKEKHAAITIDNVNSAGRHTSALGARAASARAGRSAGSTLLQPELVHIRLRQEHFRLRQDPLVHLGFSTITIGLYFCIVGSMSARSSGGPPVCISASSATSSASLSVRKTDGFPAYGGVASNGRHGRYPRTLLGTNPCINMG